MNTRLDKLFGDDLGKREEDIVKVNKVGAKISGQKSLINADIRIGSFSKDRGLSQVITKATDPRIF